MHSANRIRTSIARTLSPGVRWIQTGALFLLGLLAWSPANAQVSFSFTAAPSFVSVGDQVTTTFQTNFTLGFVGATVQWNYRLPPDTEYVIGSAQVSGPAVTPGDATITVSDTLVTFTLPFVPTGQTDFVLKIRARGDIGSSIQHRGFTGGNLPSQEFRTYSTRIEDETAFLLEQPVVADATIHQQFQDFNFGSKTTLDLSSGPGLQKRALLFFDAAAWSLQPSPAEYKVAKAYIELYPSVPKGASGSVRAYQMDEAWVEGTQVGAACATGTSWSKTNCVVPWNTPGGDFNSLVGAVDYVAESDFLSIDVTGLAVDWWRGTPDLGVILQLAGLDSHTLNLPAREASGNAVLASRLVIILAPRNAYKKESALLAFAEITPTTTFSTSPGQKFVYSLLPQFFGFATGVNRLTVTIPPSFHVTNIDSILVSGVRLTRNNDFVLNDGEFEIIDSLASLDVRFAPTISSLSASQQMDIVFNATPPSTVDLTGQDFPAMFDNDRRGHLPQAALMGNANGNLADQNSWQVRTLGAFVVRVEVTPADTAIALGFDVAYGAIAVFSDSSTVDVTDSSTWTLLPGSLGTFSTPGLLSTAAQGSGTVRAQFQGHTSNLASVNITAAQLMSLWIDPPTAELAVGLTKNLDALGAYSNGDTLVLTPAATWVIGDTLIATLLAPGQLKARTPGTTTLLASLLGVSANPIPVIVTPPELTTLVVSPADTSLALGYQSQYTAMGTYTDESVLDVTNIVTWSALPAGRINIDATGLTNTLAVGTASVTARLNGITSVAVSFTVLPPELISLDGSPNSSDLPVGTSVQLRSDGLFSNGTVEDKTSIVAWVSSNPSIANFTGPGLIQGFAPGTIQVSHSLAGIIGDTLLVRVTAATIDSIVVSPCPILLPGGVSQQMSAIGYLSDTTQQDLTSQATWVVDNTLVASITQSGMLSTHANGSTILTAGLGGQISKPCSITVTSAALDSLVISPANPSTPMGVDVTFVATGFASGNSFNLTSDVTWSSSDSLVATIDSLGVATPISLGTTAIGARFAGVLAPATTLSVDPPALVSIEVQPVTSMVRVEMSRQMTARAHYTDASITDVTSSATWVSAFPSIVFMEQTGLALGISLGSSLIHAIFGGMNSANAVIAVLPAVEVEAIPVGHFSSTPGSSSNLLLTLRLTNHDISVRHLTALRSTIIGPATTTQLWLDNGDGVFDTFSDLELDSGTPTNQRWTATNLQLNIGVAESKTFFLSSDISLTTASHNEVMDASMESDADLFWATPTAVVSPTGYPLNSFGITTVQNAVLAQFAWNAVPADTVFPGTTNIRLLDFVAPDNGGVADTLTELEIHQLGTAVAGDDILRLRLQTQTQLGSVPLDPPLGGRNGTWSEVADFIFIGNGRWVATGISIAVPRNGQALRVLADVATSATEGLDMRIEIKNSKVEFISGRVGPVDGSFANPNSTSIKAQNQLLVSQYTVTSGLVIPRSNTPQPVLGIQFTTLSSTAATLHQLRLAHDSSGPGGPSPNRDAQINSAELWHDVEADGSIGSSDILLGVASAGAIESNVFDFGASSPLNFSLPNNTTISVLVRVIPSADSLRDAERLIVRLGQPTDIVLLESLEIVLPNPLVTVFPPVVNGQSGQGYAVQFLAGRPLSPGSANVPVFDFALPGNGIDADLLQAIRIENTGSATDAEVSRLRLTQDTGNGISDASDLEIANFTPIASGTWEASGLSIALPTGNSIRFFVLLDVASSVATAATFQARLPAGGVTVASGNDGPIDGDVLGSNSFTLSASNEVTWFVLNSTSNIVVPDASNEIILTLGVFNNNSDDRLLREMFVNVQGSAMAPEYSSWKLFADLNNNGVLDLGDGIDSNDLELSSSGVEGNEVHFSSIGYTLVSKQPQQLIIAYSLNPTTARDGSSINATIQDTFAFIYAPASTPTISAGAYPLDSTGEHTINGMIRSQVRVNPDIPNDTVGGGEQDVLTLDFILPSNGLDADALESLTVQLVTHPNTAQFPTDLSELKLWAESDVDFRNGIFSANDDLIGSAQQFDSLLVFTVFPTEFIPTTGKRFYVSVSISSTPSDSAAIQLKIPVNGIQMSSTNDGPIDQSIIGSAIHRVSSSDLLPGLAVTPTQISLGQSVELRISVENRGSATLNNVTTQSLTTLPVGLDSLIGGPTPPFLTLAPGETKELVYQFAVLDTGHVQFSAVVGNAAVVSDEVLSVPITVQSPASGLMLALLSTLPSSVNRGQANVTPMTWQFTHPDLIAADLRIDTLEVRLEDGNGNGILAADIFSHVSIETGGQTYAFLDSIPSDSLMVIPLDQPLVMSSGGSFALPLSVVIDTAASVSTFRLRLLAADAVVVNDFNSGEQISLLATLPWSTQTSTVLSPSTTIALQATITQPTKVNIGQTNVSWGVMTFSLPGNPGEREARITDLALTFKDPTGAAMQSADYFTRIQINNNATTLLSTSNLTATNGRLNLTFDIQKIILSGANEDIEIFLDVIPTAALNSFELSVESSTDIIVRDTNSGSLVSVNLAGNDTFPWETGQTQIQRPASSLNVSPASISPPSSSPSGQGLRILDFTISNTDNVEHASSQLVSIKLEGVGQALEPLLFQETITAIRLLKGTTVVGQALAPFGNSFDLMLVTPMVMAPQTSEQVRVEIDLNQSIGASWLRLQARSFTFSDVNDTLRIFGEATGLPFSSDAIQILTPASDVAIGVLTQVPANVLRGISSSLMTIRIQHGGASNQASIQAQSIYLSLVNLQQEVFAPENLIRGARLLWNSTAFEGELKSDHLYFDISALSALVAGTIVDFDLQIDLNKQSSISNFSVALSDSSFLATSSGSSALPVTALDGATLPWASESIHVTAATLQASFSNYPNPFVPGESKCNVTFVLQEDSWVTCEIYTLDGQRVSILEQGRTMKAGLHDALGWDGRNGNGDTVRNGTYLLCLRVNGQNHFRKVAVIQ